MYNSKEHTILLRCAVCNEIILYRENSTQYDYSPNRGLCKCKRLEQAREILKELDNISRYKSMTFDTYKTDNSEQKRLKDAAEMYAEAKTDKSFLIIGKPGTGKTHIAVSILRAKANEGSILYMPYVEKINEIKQCRNENSYLLDKYKNVNCLFIDDLFKRKPSDSDRDIVYELINHRYMTDKATIITTELSMQEILKIDEATASRIMEMSKGYIYDVSNMRNHRI